MIRQVSFTLAAQKKGFHLITDSVLEELGDLPEAGRWQGITLCEFRVRATPRTILATLIF